MDIKTSCPEARVSYKPQSRERSFTYHGCPLNCHVTDRKKENPQKHNAESRCVRTNGQMPKSITPANSESKGTQGPQKRVICVDTARLSSPPKWRPFYGYVTGNRWQVLVQGAQILREICGCLMKTPMG